MTKLHEASDGNLIRFWRAFGLGNVQRPGTLSPDPWHFALCASSMVQKQGDASTMTASPMPPGCYGARGACRQSPIFHSTAPGLPARAVASHVGWVLNPRGTYPPIGVNAWVKDPPYDCVPHAIGPKRQMPGAWGQSPQEATGIPKPGEPDIMMAGRRPVQVIPAQAGIQRPFARYWPPACAGVT